MGKRRPVCGAIAAVLFTLAELRVSLMKIGIVARVHAFRVVEGRLRGHGHAMQNGRAMPGRFCLVLCWVQVVGRSKEAIAPGRLIRNTTLSNTRNRWFIRSGPR